MANNVVWSEDSIVNIQTDKPVSQSGEISIQGPSIQLGSLSSIVYKYDFGAEGQTVRTNTLQFSSRVVTSKVGAITRYNEYIKVSLKIQYYEASEDDPTGYIPGNYQLVNIYPYLETERDGYIRDIPVTISDSQFIKSIEFKISTNDIGENTVTIDNIKLLKSLSLTEIAEEYGGGGQPAKLKSVDTYDDGMVAYYQDSELPTTLHVTTLANNNYIIDVSGQYTFNIVLHAGSMPWDRELEQ